MAGWDIPNTPFPYFQPPPLEIPKPDNTAAKIISDNTSTLVGAFLRGAQQRQQADIDREQMAQSAALTLRGQNIQRENNRLDYDVGIKGLEALGTYRAGQLEVMKSHYGYLNKVAGERARAQGIKLALGQARDQANMEWQDTLDENDDRANQAAKDLKLDDADLAYNDPVTYYSNFEEFKNRFGTAAEGQTPSLIKQYQTRVNSIRVPYTVGASFDQAGNYVAGTGSKSTVALGPLMEQFHAATDLDQKVAIANGLLAAGNTKIAGQLIKDARTKVVSGKVSEDLNEQIGSAFKKAEQTQFGRGVDEVVQLLKTKRSKPKIDKRASEILRDQTNPPDLGEDPLGGTDMENGIPKLPELDSGTPTSMTSPPIKMSDTEQLIAQAQNAIRNGADPTAVRARLAQLLGAA